MTGAGVATLARPPRRSTWVDRLLRERVLELVRGLQDGALLIREGGHLIATPTPELASAHMASAGETLRACVRVHDPAFYRRVALNGSVGAAEAYMEGWWDSDDLVTLVRILVANRELLDGLEGGAARLAGWALHAAHALRRNTRAGSRRNIAAHYDLGNEFFALFLSPDLMYSAALWESDTDTLERASERKLARICARLQLNAGDHVLEIGSGWGGFALYAAARHGCRVTTTTISREQQRLALERVAQAGLEGRVTVLLEDYRALSGQYDKLVSIEMIEAIGAQFLPTYFGKIRQLLKPAGLALLQAITIEDHRYHKALHSVDFIKRYVFPGSFIPSIQAMLAAKTQASDLALVHLEDFGLSYAATLAAWRAAFLARADAVRGPATGRLRCAEPEA